MAATETPNGHPIATTEPGKPANGAVTTPEKRQQNRPRRPNYNLIHSKPLPLEPYPLPAFHPTNPISLLRLAYTFLSQLLAPPSSHPTSRYIGYFSLETRSVQVTDPQHARALWEMGFFGKGTLSRSEPSWIDREKARLKAQNAGPGTAEEATNLRRQRRRLFKLERDRAEKERVQTQRLVEQGKLDPKVLQEGDALLTTAAIAEARVNAAMQQNGMPLEARSASAEPDSDDEAEEMPEPDVENQEHLQLTLEEAFFLTYGFGVLEVRSSAPALSPTKETAYDTRQLIQNFAAQGFFPPKTIPYKPAPDDKFLLNYVVYHHFRSLGWVVRPGVKFSADYMLYLRGPVFSHAEFAVIIFPAYTDAYWSTDEGKAARRVKEQHDWWWLHCVNRVQSAVLKTLVMCYVDVPAPVDGDIEDIGAFLKSYKVREFIIKRWVANRQRD
ncbi:putative tRNA-splicing endonuclease subunit sen2 [Pseudocercospora fuligena]|uniref:tRNA-splicing endonuclease subunit Sen2 n=1 Tax=Pseudocercospora fuligena TaxID=685502 RepID=A0A8H6VPI7_9PEZI|nr:putative tRNA-splicing endonuclease subunit sen2 [Pseudocercospora fuligena]